MQPSSDVKLPVFVFPNALTFYLEDKATHKQILTLYNPYEFDVSFKVLCTSPKKYHVVDPECSVKSKCCVDIVFRHTSVSPVHLQVTDKFRIQMYDSITKKLLGKRDVTATLISGEPDNSTPDQDFESLSATLPHSQAPQTQYSLVPSSTKGPEPVTSPNTVFLTSVAALCMAVLFLPTVEEKRNNDSAFAAWAVSANLKLVACYVLGLVTMAILKPS